MLNKILVLGGFLVLTLGAGALGAIFIGSVGEWYAQLAKPSFTPPSWVFGPVWTVLYILMAVAAFLTWQRRGNVTAAMTLFFMQLVLNAAWSPVFFGLHSPGGGMLIILPLWALVILTTILFWRVAAGAGILMIPYAAWVSYATVLNASIWWMNR